MVKEQKRLRKQLLKYLLLFAIVIAVALRNIYNIEKEKATSDNSTDVADTSQIIATDAQINTNEVANSNGDGILKQANLNKVSTIDGKGTATISMSDNFFVHQINLDTKDPDQNSVYEAWVYKEKPQKEYFPLGQLNNKDGSYQISYVSELYRLDFTKIIISKESQNKELGQEPTKVLFEGDFKSIE